MRRLLQAFDAASGDVLRGGVAVQDAQTGAVVTLLISLEVDRGSKRRRVFEVAFWNAGVLRARAVVDGRTLPESVRKFEWLLATFNGGNRPDVILFIAEIAGSAQELAELRR